MPHEPFVIHRCREVVTMNPANPAATHVAIAGARILGAGSYEELAVWGEHVVDDTFADLVVLPGMIDAHAHTLEGAMWALEYVGWFERTDPEGRRRGGFRTVAALIDHLRRLDAELGDPAEPLICWGFDPIYFAGERLVARHLDEVSTTRPVFLWHASAHLATVNTAMLRVSGITADTETEGVLRDGRGEPNGELQEFAAMMLTPVFLRLVGLMATDEGLHRLGALARNAGVTTIGNMGAAALGRPESADLVERVVGDPTFPMRIVQYCTVGGALAAPDDPAMVEAFLALRARNAAPGEGVGRVHYGGVKIVADGSIQGYTAVLRWPGYVTGAPDGLWQVAPDQLRDVLGAFHDAGVNVHVHANGDAVVDAVIDAVDLALRRTAWLDHRHTVQHCQLASPAQYRRMARLGMCANVFANHLWYWGDQHHDATVGPERAHRLEACATAKREGVRFSLHSDANVTPLGQLHTMWCAVNRVTPSGRVLGPHERISATDALQAVTLDAAHQMHLDQELGSIEVGKTADLTILHDNPLTVDPMAIRDIEVWGTVVGGVVHPAP